MVLVGVMDAVLVMVGVMVTIGVEKGVMVMVGDVVGVIVVVGMIVGVIVGSMVFVMAVVGLTVDSCVGVASNPGIGVSVALISSWIAFPWVIVTTLRDSTHVCVISIIVSILREMGDAVFMFRFDVVPMRFDKRKDKARTILKYL